MKWQIWIDTGGTFTDCIGVSPDGRINRVKLLSNSTLRGKVLEVNSDGSIQVDIVWNVSKDIFKGYVFNLLGSSEKGVIDEIELGN